MMSELGSMVLSFGEKHLPVVSAQDGQVRVNVGSASHPMTPEHLIQWVYLELLYGEP